MSNRKNKTYPCLSTFGFLLSSCCALVFESLCALPAYAADSHGSYDAHHPLLVQWVNFSVYVLVLFLFLRKPLINFFAERSRSIKEDVDSAAKALAFEEQRHVEAASRLRGLAQEVELLRETSAVDTASLVSSIISNAEARAGKIVASAHETLVSERLSGEKELRNLIIERVLDLARTRISSTYSSEQDRGLRRSTVLKARDTLS
jgi:F-type H+-transporting ATPase subunit b